MFEFENTTIFSGYLKQLLKSFNLPKIPVYTRSHRIYSETHDGQESPEILGTLTTGHTSNSTLYYLPYIKDNSLQEYIDGKWVKVGLAGSTTHKHTHVYNYGDKLLNYTKNLKITNNIYDSYTHEYLGDFLRFKRDYEDVDLMPLYNCFSNRLCTNIKQTISLPKFPNGSISIKIDSSNTAYKIYMLPVKLFKNYTVAIESDSPIELWCDVYGKYLDTRPKFNGDGSMAIANNTYQKLPSMYFAQPVLYTRLGDFCKTLSDDASVPADNSNKLLELAQNERDLKLFIRMPAQNTSSIVILEGDYCAYADKTVSMAGENSLTSFNTSFDYNRSVINLEPAALSKDFYSDQFTPITPLQLLQANTKKQHPFSDRLVEYLLRNCITAELDELSANVKRTQKVITNSVGAESTNKLGYSPIVYGAWDTNISKILYEYMSTKVSKNNGFVDSLGFVDKDVEKWYKTTNNLKNTDKTLSLTTVELNEEGY